MKNFFKVNRGRPAIIGILVLLCVIFFSASAIGCGTEEECTALAQEARHKAMMKSCEKIGKKLNACYSGDRDVCEALLDSNSWFYNQYKEYPEIACTTDPFTDGNVQE